MVKSSIFRLSSTCCMVLLVLGSILVTVLADSPPDEVKRAAEEGLPEFLSVIPRDDIEAYGFRSPEELDEATLGEPYKVYTIPPQVLQSYDQDMKLSPLLSDIDLWYFPIMVNGEARTMLEVSLIEGHWEASDIGGTVLPQRLQSLSTRLPEILGSEAIDEQYSAKFVRIFHGYLDFIVVESNGAEHVIPVLADPGQLGVQNNQLYAPSEIIPKFSELVPPAAEDLEYEGGAGELRGNSLGDHLWIIIVALAIVFAGLVATGLLKAKKAL